ncbi:MAG: hypothetical protein OXB86_04460, partial [Bdellovibrionales bacterium]|nr:hypothetical protein [Bdellovibrionales bacterium]
MRFFNYFFFVSFILYPVLSFSETPSSGGSEQCQSKLKGLEDERAAEREEYNKSCDSTNSHGARCLGINQRISDLSTQISNQSQRCQGIALEIQKRQVKDAKGSVDKQDKKTKTLGMLSTAVGTGLIAKGMSTCGSPSCNWPLIALGVAGVGMGINLMANSGKLKKTSEGLSDAVDTCVGDHCTPPPSPPSGGGPPPQGPPLGSGFLGAGLPGPPL